MILVGIGSNLAAPGYRSPQDTALVALAQLPAIGAAVIAVSPWYLSEPVPASDQPWFVNAVASVATDLCAPALLAVLQAVETRFGRVRSERNAARVVDLDLLDYRGQVTETTSLILPHPRLVADAADPPEGIFNRMQYGQNLGWGEIGGDLDDRVQIPGLVRDRHGF